MSYSKQKIDEFKKMKIGALVRFTLPKILQTNKISDVELIRLQELDYSKFTFDVDFPVLRKINENKSIRENRTERNYTRYYANPVLCSGHKYLITSEWYERNLSQYIIWLERKVKD